MRPWTRWRLELADRLRPLAWQRTLAVAAMIGMLGGLTTIGFRELILLTERWAYGNASGSLVLIARGLTWWQRMLVPAVGGLFAGMLLSWARRQPEHGKGGDYMEAVSLGTGDLGARASVLRALSAAATVASGGAIGREGPMVQLAALCGSLIGRWQKVAVPRRRLYVACGAAAGVATAYNAPIAGAMFVAEIVLRSLAVESIGPLLVAAVAANIVAGTWTDYAPVYHMPAIALGHGAPTLALAGLGLIAGMLAPAYLSLLDAGRMLFERWHGQPWQKLAAGGLLAGAVSVFHPGVWGNGYSVVNDVLQGTWVWQALLVILLLKLLALASTVGSGAVGGIFTPTLFVGAVVGALFGAALQAWRPGLVPIPAAVAVGMGAFLAACTHAPLMSILMLFEMTASYGIVVPLMAACVLGYSVSRLLRDRSIYASANGTVPHAAVLTMASDLLRSDPPVIKIGQSMLELEQVFLRRRWQHVYVIDEGAAFRGAVSLHDFGPAFSAASDPSQPWPTQLLQADYPHVPANAALWQVLETFAKHPGERLPVLDQAGRLSGYLTKTDLMLMFRQIAG
jgi:CIC family chloride channel protein